MPIDPVVDSEVTTVDIDWQSLRGAARDAALTAYAPYSSYPVGAAGLVDDGRVVTGANVENASYGLTLCAECGMVSDLVRSGGGRLVAVVALHPEQGSIPPCGRCRQLLREHGGTEVLVDTPDGPMSLDQLLPWSFGPEHL